MTPAGRPLDQQVSAAIREATLRLLVRDGFAALSIEGVAREAGVGKPAIYRRFAGKPELVVAAIATALPPMEPPPPGDAETRLRTLFATLPADADAYLALIGGLFAEHRRHPELIAAFREQLLLPRRKVVSDALVEAQERGEVRADVEPEHLLDLLAGPLLARTFAGRDVGPGWREAAFADWWKLVRPDARFAPA